MIKTWLHHIRIVAHACLKIIKDKNHHINDRFIILSHKIFMDILLKLSLSNLFNAPNEILNLGVELEWEQEWELEWVLEWVLELELVL